MNIETMPHIVRTEINTINEWKIGDSAWSIVYEIKHKGSIAYERDLYIPKRVVESHVSYHKFDSYTTSLSARYFTFCKPNKPLDKNERLGITISYGTQFTECTEPGCLENVHISFANHFHTKKEAELEFFNKCKNFIEQSEIVIINLQNIISSIQREQTQITEFLNFATIDNVEL